MRPVGRGITIPGRDVIQRCVMAKRNRLSRRDMLQAAAVASFGSAILAGTPASAQQAPNIQVGKDPGHHEPIPSFKFNIESSSGSWTGEAGSAREATMTEFP